MLGKLIWATLVGWGGVGGVLLLLCVLGFLIEDPQVPPRRRVLRLLMLFPLLMPICVLGWPFIAAVAWVSWRRDRLRDRILHGPHDLDVAPLTPEQWSGGANPPHLLAGLAERLTPRQSRLIAWGCCRRLGRFLEHPILGKTVERGGSSLDGWLPVGEHEQATAELRAVLNQAITDGDLRLAAAARACLGALEGDAAATAFRVLLARGGWGSSERRAQMRVVRDVVGDPFRPLPPRAFPCELRELARAIDAGDEALRPLLADALAELGEDEAARHCREGGHARGCHVLDWVRGADEATGG